MNLRMVGDSQYPYCKFPGAVVLLSIPELALTGRAVCLALLLLLRHRSCVRGQLQPQPQCCCLDVGCRAVGRWLRPLQYLVSPRSCFHSAAASCLPRRSQHAANCNVVQER